MSRADPQRKRRPAGTERRKLKSERLDDNDISTATGGRCQRRVRTDRELDLLATAWSIDGVDEVAFTTDKNGARIARRPVPDGFSGQRKPEDVSCFWFVTNLLDGLGASGKQDDGVVRDMLDAALRLLDGRKLLSRSDREALYRAPWYQHHLEGRDGPTTRAIEDAIERAWLDQEQGAYLIRRVVHLCRIVRDLVALHYATPENPRASHG